jgi:hypothetical protein
LQERKEMLNERIKELFKRAGGKTSIHNLMSNPMQQREYNELWNENIDKFAKLIVKECVVCAEREWIRNGDTEHNRAVTKVIESIKQHFGVE